MPASPATTEDCDSTGRSLLMHKLRGPSAGLHFNDEHHQLRGAKVKFGGRRVQSCLSGLDCDVFTPPCAGFLRRPGGRAQWVDSQDRVRLAGHQCVMPSGIETVDRTVRTSPFVPDCIGESKGQQ